MENQQIENAESSEETTLATQPHTSDDTIAATNHVSDAKVEAGDDKSGPKNESAPQNPEEGGEKSNNNEAPSTNENPTTSEEKKAEDIDDSEETKAPEPNTSEETIATETKPFNKEEFYETFSKDRYNKFKELLNTNFDPSPEKDGVKLSWLLEEVRGLYYVKAETDIKVSPKTIRDLILNEEKLQEWDKTIDFVKRVEIVNDCKISYSISKKMGMVIEKRDCCVLVKTYEEGNDTIIAGGSFEHPDYPPQNVPVRCEIPIWGWQLSKSKNDENLTHATYIVLIDPKGWVPKQVLNAACTEQAMNVKSIKNYLEGTKEEKKGMFGFLKKPW